MGINFFLIVIVFGLYLSINVIEDWYFKPNYLTNNATSFFAGFLFVGLGVVVALVGIACPKGFYKRCLSRLAWLFMLAAPVWSITACYLHSKTIDFYRDSPQFGICVQQGGRGYTTMYVSNSDWCKHFERKITRPAPGKKGE